MPGNKLTARELLQRALVPSLIVLLLMMSVTAGYFFFKSKQSQTTPEQASEAEVTALVAEVGELILLPADEVPTVATVSDPEQLKSQPFFANAKVGDKVLLFAKAKKAILYDPVAHRLIEVAPINLGEPAL